MGKHIHILLDEKAWNELQEIRDKYNLINIDFDIETKNMPKTYKEYLKEEEKNPTMAWCA